MSAAQEAGRMATQRCGLVWTPDSGLFGLDGFDHGGRIYLPPVEYLPRPVVTRRCPRSGSAVPSPRPDTARTCSSDSRRERPRRLEVSGDGGDLTLPCHQIQTRYHDRTWRLRQSSIGK